MPSTTRAPSERVARLSEGRRGLGLAPGEPVGLEPGDDRRSPGSAARAQVDLDEVVRELARGHREVAVGSSSSGSGEVVGDGHADETALARAAATYSSTVPVGVAAALGVDVAVDQLAHAIVPPPRTTSPR